MHDLVAALARYDSPTLANAIETFDIQPRDVGFADSRIRCMFPELGRMVGFAATATIVARGAPGPDWAGASNDGLYAHVRTIAAPRIVVVEDLDDPPVHGDEVVVEIEGIGRLVNTCRYEPAAVAVA